MREDVGRLVVEVEPAVEAGRNRSEDRSIAGVNVWIVTIPRGDFADGEKS